MSQSSSPSSTFDDWYHWAVDPLRASVSRLRIVEDASAQDAEALADLHDAAFPIGWNAQDLSSLIDDPAVTTRMIRPLSWFGRGPVEGFVMVRQASDEGEVLTFAVAQHCQGRGYGTRLLDDALMALRQKGVRAVFLEVADGNNSAITLYRRRGFAQVGERPAYATLADGSKGRALVMRREYG
ncbi:MAG: GNAT family N-acetyltransferase [Pseudomonadota bacterium]